MIMRLGTFWKEKLDHRDRALSLCTVVCEEVFAGARGAFVAVCVVACVLQRAERRSRVHVVHVLQCLDNFSHESDVMSLQDPFTSCPYKTPFYFYYCVSRKIPRGILFQIRIFAIFSTLSLCLLQFMPPR